MLQRLVATSSDEVERDRDVGGARPIAEGQVGPGRAHHPVQAGSVTSATCAPKRAITSSASAVAATPCAPAPIEITWPTIPLVVDDGEGGRGAERRDRAALVAGYLPGDLGVGHRDAVDAQECSQLGPRDLPVAAHEDEQVVARPTPYDHRLDDRPGRHSRASAASARDRTRPCRVTAYPMPDSASARRAGVSSDGSGPMEATRLCCVVRSRAMLRWDPAPALIRWPV